MTSEVTSLYGEALARLREANKDITPETVSDFIATTHTQKCCSWRNIKVDAIRTYILFCITKLCMTDFSCEIIAILHEYLNLSHQHFPTKREDLARFHGQGIVPTYNLHLLRAEPASKTGHCAMCCAPFTATTLVLKLPCGHMCCDRRDPTCNLPGWLASSGRCPHCALCVQFEEKRVTP